MLLKLTLILKLIFTPFSKLALPKNFKILAIDNEDEKLKISQQYIRNQIEYIHSLQKISWNDIFWRKIRFVSIPRSKNRNNLDKFKWIAIRYLNLTISEELKIINLHHILYNEPHKFNIVTASNHAYNIYRENLQKFNPIHSFDHLSTIYCIIGFTSALFACFTKQQNKETGITVFTNPKSYLTLKAYSKINPQKNIVIRFHDVLKTNDKQLIKKVKSNLPRIIIESYSIVDAYQNNIKYRPNGISPKFIKQCESPYRCFLYKFDGAKSESTNTPRTEPLDLINKEIHAIYNYIHPWLRSTIKDSLDSYLSYKEYCKISATAEIVIDLIRVTPSEGFSFRIPEALFLNRKIITNRIILLKEPFYDSDRIFIIGHDSLSRLKEFLEKDISPLPSKILRYYNSDLWWTKFDPY